MMTASELVRRCRDIADNYKTVYMWGAVGMPVTKTTIELKRGQPVIGDWYTPAKVAELSKLVGRDYWGFDCVNLIKAILWGWTGDAGKTYGGASYASGGVPDISANGAIAKCRGVTTVFSDDIPAGAALWCEGHIGVYIGEGLAVECTPAWANGVQYTVVGNIAARAGYNKRKWTKWGLLPWVDYEKEDELDMTKEELLAVAGTGDKPSAWAVEATEWAKSNGIFNGDGAGNYGWDKPITREGVAAILHNFARYMGKE